jgi:hypothetical protein
MKQDLMRLKTELNNPMHISRSWVRYLDWLNFLMKMGLIENLLEVDTVYFSIGASFMQDL